MDIFGQRSLFTKIDKTSTCLGADALRDYLSNPLTQCKEIEQRQEAVKELSQKPEWNIRFLANAKSLELQDKSLLTNKLSVDFPWKIVSTILIVIPVINILLLTLAILKDFSPVFLGVFLAFSIISLLVVNSKYSKQLKKAYSVVNLRSEQYSRFSEIFQLIEKEAFDTALNKNLQAKLTHPLASSCIDKLSGIKRNLDNGHTPLFGSIANLLFLWNLRCTVELAKLMNLLNEHIDNWFEAFAEYEALISLGIFAYKNPQYNYPVCREDIDSLQCKDIVHPLLDSGKAIGNDFTIGNTKNICIVTGANMTGKSTFLRTIGVNLVLAMNGCPVGAEEFAFRPMHIFTSMRTSDSLSDGSSYFNAEIKRLKSLVETLEEKIPLYIILDEILKGTNSTDKLEGSRLFLRRIMDINTDFSCIIATHDLPLTDMAKTYPENVSNLCFELDEKNGELISDYKLKSGVTQTMNALRLMKAYKIID
ncbi:MutS-related protein [Elizabethkingia anophelis]|uniref:MutS-related protein n=1 Tax=Elizabethkingia anophelis TaxID=1117645 RepID=UPI002468A380|nr:DNA mismatch repair protein MutS [Elizabethkingia anophelis]WGL71075.1 DNA mismatch repair protein MutS [Elizabethkingia anophelis]